jgi:hypothetical protein
MVSDAEKWAVEFHTCNRILAAIGMVEYQLGMEEEQPVDRLIELLTKRHDWIHEADTS